MRRKRAKPSSPSSRCRIARACRSKSSSLVSLRGIIAPPPDTRIPGSGRAREARCGIARRGEAVRRQLSGTRRLALALRLPDAERQTTTSMTAKGSQSKTNEYSATRRRRWAVLPARDLHQPFSLLCLAPSTNAVVLAKRETEPQCPQSRLHNQWRAQKCEAVYP